MRHARVCTSVLKQPWLGSESKPLCHAAATPHCPRRCMNQRPANTDTAAHMQATQECGKPAESVTGGALPYCCACSTCRARRQNKRCPLAGTASMAKCASIMCINRVHQPCASTVCSKSHGCACVCAMCDKCDRKRMNASAKCEAIFRPAFIHALVMQSSILCDEACVFAHLFVECVP